MGTTGVRPWGIPMTVPGEIRWPSVGNSVGRLWGVSRGRRQTGDNPERLHSEAAWAHLCGVAPVPDGSGRTSGRVKAHDGGDRQANSALWRIVMVRIAHDPESRVYFERRVKEGKTKHEVIRILKRYVAREVYRYLPRG
jgi:transposase